MVSQQLKFKGSVLRKIKAKYTYLSPLVSGVDESYRLSLPSLI